MQKERNSQYQFTYLLTYLDMAKIKNPCTTKSLKHDIIYNIIVFLQLPEEYQYLYLLFP